MNNTPPRDTAGSLSAHVRSEPLEPRLIRCQATRKNPRFAGERCNGFVFRTTRRLRVHSVVRHSDEAPRDHDIVGCVRCGALHVLAPVADPDSGARVVAPP